MLGGVNTTHLTHLGVSGTQFLPTHALVQTVGCASTSPWGNTPGAGLGAFPWGYTQAAKQV